MLEIIIAFICGAWFGVGTMAVLSIYKFTEKENSNNVDGKD